MEGNLRARLKKRGSWRAGLRLGGVGPKVEEGMPWELCRGREIWGFILLIWAGFVVCVWYSESREYRVCAQRMASAFQALCMYYVVLLVVSVTVVQELEEAMQDKERPVNATQKEEKIRMENMGEMASQKQ